MTFKCPVCKKSFKTAEAMKQHELSKHPNARVSNASNNRKKKKKKKSPKEISDEGFLKCAFAPVDFANTGFMGIPDGTTEKTNKFDSTLIDTLTVLGGATMYYCNPPIPEVAYMFSNSLTGDWSVVRYPTHKDVFPDGKKENVSAFRFAANVMEFTNTTAALDAGGSMLVVEAHLGFGESISVPGSGSTGKNYQELVVDGFPARFSTNVWADNAKEGVYACNSNGEANFQWNQVLESELSIVDISMNNGGKIKAAAGKTGTDSDFAVRGLDESFSTKIYQITAPGGKAQTFTLRCFQCVEYLPEPDSLLARLATVNPPYNPATIAKYRHIARNLPIAVTRRENGKFWDLIKKIGRTVSGALSYVPGPVGMIAKGVHGLVS